MRDRVAKFIDKSLWEEAERKGSKALKTLIEDSLKGTSVTIILIGSETHSRKWVKYEIIKSFCEGKGIFGIHINRIPSRNERIIAKGENPLERIGLEVSDDYKTITFYELVDRKWQVFKELSEVNNRKSNSAYFPEFENGLSEFFGIRSGLAGKFFKFSQVFPGEYDWVTDDGYKNVVAWIEKSYTDVNS
jgi:hypothetical protein